MRGRRSRPIAEMLPDLGSHVHGLLPAWGGQRGGVGVLSAFPLPPCAPFGVYFGHRECQEGCQVM